MTQTYIIPYAAGFGRGKSFIDSTARTRCDKALTVARGYDGAIFVLGAGISAVGLRRYHASLEVYLRNADKPCTIKKLLQPMNLCLS